MSVRLLEGLDPVAALLLQVAARQEHVPVQLTIMPPLREEPDEVVARVEERGLLAPSEVEGIHVLTPIGHALRDEILARWPDVHAALRPRLLDYLVDELGLPRDGALHRAFQAVDRADFIPEPARVLADIDMPAPTGVAEMTTSAPHALAALLRAVAPAPGERILVCGAKGGVLAALAASLVGPTGSVTVVDDTPATDALVRQGLATHPHLAGRVTVGLVEDVTVGPAQGGPWDCVVMNGSMPKLPWALVERLTARGRLLLFLQRPNQDGQSCTLVRPDRSLAFDEDLSRFSFTPLYGRYGWDRI